MKLLNKTGLIIITVSLFIYFIGGIGFFHFIRTMINSQIDAELELYASNLVKELNQFQNIENSMLITENNVQLKRIDANSHIASTFKDTILLEKNNNTYVPYRMYQTHAFVGDANFKISIFRSTLSSENLIQRIIAFMSIMLLLLVICLFFLNRYLFKRIWDDFFHTIDQINQFNWQTGDSIELPESEIQEFELLNSSINRMTKRIRSDFINLKEFTENASHELQTPLAVMRSKIELLLQKEDIKEEQLIVYKSLYDAVNRLANMNRVLILLTKIENNQFPEKVQLDLKERIEFHLENFGEMLESKQLKLESSLDESIQYINEELADILLINLIKNAIRHNEKNGIIKINLNQEVLEVINSGPKPEFDPNKMFERFTKTSLSKESIGLGLSIVKKICDLNHFTISFEHWDKLNYMKVFFKK